MNQTPEIEEPYYVRKERLPGTCLSGRNMKDEESTSGGIRIQGNKRKQLYFCILAAKKKKKKLERKSFLFKRHKNL